jgi:hypothetical protein
MADPRDDGKRRAIKGGLVHRALDIELADIAAESPVVQRSAVVSSIKVGCARHYGHAGPELIRQIASQFATISEARAYVREQTAHVVAEIAPAGLPAETDRAIRRFALIAVAGILAADHRIIPTTRAAVIEATRTTVTNWLGTAAETDEQRIVASVRDFILRHESRFQPINEPEPEPKTDRWGNEYQPQRREAEPVRDRVGFVDRDSGRWLFTDAGLTEAAPGHDRTTIAKALKAAGLLYTNDTGRLTVKVSVNRTDRPRLYVVVGSILESEENATAPKTAGAAGAAGADPATARPEAAPPGTGAPGQPGHDHDGGMVSAPPAPPGQRAPGQPSAQQRRGPAPPAPPAPAKNRASEIFQAPDNDDDARPKIEGGYIRV